MASEATPYIKVNPGDIILAEDIDSMQVQIKQDIAKKVADAVSSIKKVDQAGDATTLDGKDLATIEKEVASIVLGQISKKGGAQILFRQLTLGEKKVIVHNRGSFPVVDAYQLGYFQVICPEDENTRRLTWVNFYIYHASEAKIRTTALLSPSDTTQTQKQVTVEIEPGNLKQQYKVKFTEMLKRYDVTWDSTTLLEVLVQDFWTKFFDPNEAFDEDQYCHSPWFDGCCKEQKTVGDLKGELDKLYFKMQPQKTVNYLLDAGDASNPSKGILPPNPTPPSPPGSATGDPTLYPPFGYELPHNIEVVHYDFNTMGIELVAPPVYPRNLIHPESGPPLINPDQLKVMLILCC